MIDRILMELYDEYEKDNIEPLITFARRTFPTKETVNLFIGCTLIMFSKTGFFKPRYDSTREKLLSIVLSSKEKIGNTNLLAFYIDRVNKHKGINKYLNQIVKDDKLDEYADVIINYLEQFKPKFSQNLKRDYTDKIEDYINPRNKGDKHIKKQFENDSFILYAPDSLNYVTKDMEEILDKSLELYKKIFNVNNFRKVQINYFDDIKEFRNYIYTLRGESNSLPEYAKGTFDNGMINAYIESNIVDKDLYNKRKYNASHELFHIMYNELILNKNNVPRIIWFDEGMAQLFSGEYTQELKHFNSFVKKVLSETKTVPNLNKLSHGSSFITNDYNGYNLSLIAIKYLYDNLGLDEFKKLLYDNDKIIKYGETILETVINYYNGV